MDWLEKFWLKQQVKDLEMRVKYLEARQHAPILNPLGLTPLAYLESIYGSTATASLRSSAETSTGQAAEASADPSPSSEKPSPLP